MARVGAQAPEKNWVQSARSTEKNIGVGAYREAPKKYRGAAPKKILGSARTGKRQKNTVGLARNRNYIDQVRKLLNTRAIAKEDTRRAMAGARALVVTWLRPCVT